MNIKNLVLYAAMLALGVVLHLITPGLLGSMKPDFLLSTFFICLVIAPTYREVIMISVACAILAALTTTIPGGEIGNIVDKMITGSVLYLFHRNLGLQKNILFLGLFGFIGTMISGTIFLLTLQFIGMIPAPFISLFVSVVVPAGLVNMVFFTVLYKGFERVNHKVFSLSNQ